MDPGHFTARDIQLVSLDIRLASILRSIALASLASVFALYIILTSVKCKYFISDR